MNTAVFMAHMVRFCEFVSYNSCTDLYIFFLYLPKRIFEESEKKGEGSSVSKHNKNTSQEKKNHFFTKKTV